MDVRDSKFQFLFEPIKDLAKNFNIDLNYHLDEYLNQLEADDVLVPNGSSTINFVEAAFILRGSAVVYAKKVDYLYDLTLKILESLTSDKKIKKSSNISGDYAERDVTKAEMSALDDIELSKNLVCREEVDETSLCISMPTSLQRQKVLINQKTDGNISESDFDKKNFTINNCKILKSTLILNYSEMKPLLNSIESYNMNNKVNDTNNFNSCAPEDVQINIETNDSPNITCANIEEFIEPESIIADHHNIEFKSKEEVAIDEYPKEQQAIKSSAKVDLHLLDPYELEDAKFAKKEKIGRTFKYPPSLLNKGNVTKSDSLAIKCFLANYCIGKQPLKKAPVEREFQDLLLMKQKQMKTKTSVGSGTDRKFMNDSFSEDEVEDNVINNDDNPFEIGADCQDEIPIEIPMSYENAVQNHLAQFFSLADRYKVMSDLTQRVAEWESKIVPMLELESKTKPYDIKEYSVEFLNILENCGGIKRPVQFSEVVANKSHLDICRLFMAALHLTDHCNIEISNNHQEPNLFCLKILSKDLCRDEFMD